MSLATQQHLAEQNARLTERSRITRELHDGVSQDLFSLRLLTGGLQAALPSDSSLQPQLAALEQTTERIARELRALLLELRPTVLAERGLQGALEDVIATYRARLGITFESRIEPLTITAATELAVLRMSQEAIANAVRHAGATAISLSLTGQPDDLTLTIADNGKGLDAAGGQETHGLGLRLMRERVRELHGVLTMTTAPGTGTQLCINLPRP